MQKFLKSNFWSSRPHHSLAPHTLDPRMIDRQLSLIMTQTTNRIAHFYPNYITILFWCWLLECHLDGNHDNSKQLCNQDPIAETGNCATKNNTRNGHGQDSESGWILPGHSLVAEARHHGNGNRSAEFYSNACHNHPSIQPPAWSPRNHIWTKKWHNYHPIWNERLTPTHFAKNHNPSYFSNLTLTLNQCGSS